jgi:hypothetical protein
MSSERCLVEVQSIVYCDGRVVSSGAVGDLHAPRH